VGGNSTLLNVLMLLMSAAPMHAQWGAGLLQWRDPVVKTTHVSIYTVCGVGVLRLPYIDTTSVFDVADVSSAHACMDDIILRAGLLQWKDPMVKSTPHQQLHRV
jgi:hypothetical protein